MLRWWLRRYVEVRCGRRWPGYAVYTPPADAANVTHGFNGRGAVAGSWPWGREKKVSSPPHSPTPPPRVCPWGKMLSSRVQTK